MSVELETLKATSINKIWTSELNGI
jgi:hypothetical protein